MFKLNVLKKDIGWFIDIFDTVILERNQYNPKTTGFEATGTLAYASFQTKQFKIRREDNDLDKFYVLTLCGITLSFSRSLYFNIIEFDLLPSIIVNDFAKSGWQTVDNNCGWLKEYELETCINNGVHYIDLANDNMDVVKKGL